MDERLLVWLEWLFTHKGKVAGVILGIGFGWLSIQFGILKAVFVILCMVVGLVVGYRYDSRRSWAEILDLILPHGSTRLR